MGHPGRQPTSILDRFTFVMVRPKAAGNIGAAARALKNMGFGDLRLVAPARFLTKAAFDMAVHARDNLERARVFPDLSSALEGCSLSVGTTSRSGLYRSSAAPLRIRAPELIASQSHGRIAILFGPEDFGLTNEDLKFCQQLVRIPAASDYASINVAQSMLLVAYELRMAAMAAEDHVAGDETDRALVVEVEAALKRFERALIAIGFLPADNPDHIMMAIRAMHGRGGVTPRELEILNGIASQISWYARGGHVTIEAKRRAGKRIR